MDDSTYTIDFSREGRRRVHLFSYLLAYSRRQYLHFVESQDFTTTIREHVRAFEYFQGVAATCLYDNMKVVVTKYDGDEPVYNTRFLGFATHYGYRPVACRPRRSQTKGKVERPFHYVEKNLLNGRTFRSLEHLNEVTRWWLANVADVRIHRGTKKRPLDAHAEEQPHLLPLPAHPFETDLLQPVRSGKTIYVRFDLNDYSIPHTAIQRPLTLVASDTRIRILDGQTEIVFRGCHAGIIIRGDGRIVVSSDSDGHGRRCRPEYRPGRCRDDHRHGQRGQCGALPLSQEDARRQQGTLLRHDGKAGHCQGPASHA